MDTNQLEAELQSHQAPIIKEAVQYYVKMTDAIIRATTQDLQAKHQQDLSALEREHEAHCQKLELQHAEHVADQLRQQQVKHDKAMKSQGSTHASLPIVQTYSKTITEREKEIEVLKLQIKGLRKQLTDAKSPTKIVHLPTPQLSIHPPTPMTVSSIDTPIPVANLGAQLAIETTTTPEETTSETTTPNKATLEEPASEEPASEEPASEEPASEEPVYVAPPVSTLKKIKFKDTVYYLDKVANGTGEQLVYECTDNQPGQIVGRKTQDGKYVF